MITKKHLTAAILELKNAQLKTDKQLAAGFAEIKAAQLKTDKQLAETDKQLAETDKQLAKTDKQLAKTDAQITETYKQLAETDAQLAKTDAQLAQTNKQLAKTDAQLAQTDAQLAKTDKQLAKTDAQLAQTDAQLAKTDKQLAQTDAQLAKTDAQLAKTDAQLAKTDAQLAKTDNKLDRLCKMVGGISNNQGDIAEEFYFNSLQEDLILNGIRFDSINRNMSRNRNGIASEYDLLLVNGKDIFILEVKYKAHESDIALIQNKFIIFKTSYPEYKNYAHHIGLATFAISDKLKNSFLRQGITVLQRKGKVIETFVA